MFAQRNRANTTDNAPPSQVPTGMAMMFKALGFDPAAFGANVEAAKTAAVQTIQHFDQRLNTLEATQVMIVHKMDELAQLFRELIECQNRKM